MWENKSFGKDPEMLRKEYLNHRGKYNARIDFDGKKKYMAPIVKISKGTQDGPRFC